MRLCLLPELIGAVLEYVTGVQELKSAVDVDAAAEDLPNLTAAFCQAVAELEVMGYVLRNKRKGAYKVQRDIFPPPMWHT
jgi:hypothetical protein